MNRFLSDSAVIDWHEPAILALAKELRGPDGAAAIAARCFTWVRDEIRHSADHADQIVTCAASEVLRHRTGMCYAKSHLLAALLRANGIPAGLAYQRLATDEAGSTYCLHGLNAVFLPETGWYRADARGNRPGIATTFSPPIESLAFEPQLAGEATFDAIWSEPLPVVLSALRQCRTVAELLTQLPDLSGAPPAEELRQRSQPH
jgi:transglutaminase-like putative cysteine protease